MPGQELEPYVNEDGEVLLSAPMAERVRELLSHVPSEGGGGSESIVEQLLAANTLEEIGDPWQATGGRDLKGCLIRIDSAQLRPSTFGGGLGAFMVVKGFNDATGKNITFTTSALAVVIQVARCIQMGWLPAYFEVVVADRPTEKGYYPYHLEARPTPSLPKDK